MPNLSSVLKSEITRLARKEVKSSVDPLRKANAAHIEETARSIRAFGFCAPVLIESSGRIIDGHIRWEAARSLGMESIPCIVIERELTEDEIISKQLAHNALTGQSDADLLRALYDSMQDGRDSVSGDFLVARFRYTYDAPIGDGTRLSPRHDGPSAAAGVSVIECRPPA